jgi:hypothetical protein
MKAKGMTMCAVLIAAVTVIGSMMLGGHSGPALDPLSEWIYPNAKQVEGETWEEFLPWATYATTDPFERVWQFYWTKKITYPMPLPFDLKKRASASMSANDPRWGVTHFAYVYEPSPSGKWGVLVIRRKSKTVSIYIIQGATKKQTTIVVILDKR